MSRLLTALVVLLVSLPGVALSQTRAPAGSLTPGARVRIAQAGEKPRVGIVVARTADTLLVKWPEFASSAAVPFADISRLDVSTGRHRRVLKGMALGTVGVGTIGAIAGAISYQPCQSTEFLGCLFAPASRSDAAAFGGVVGGALGLVVGSLVGLQRHESWKRVSLDDRRVAIALAPRGQATGVGVSLHF
jgi:hypothetical protein